MSFGYVIGKRWPSIEQSETLTALPGGFCVMGKACEVGAADGKETRD